MVFISVRQFYEFKNLGKGYIVKVAFLMALSIVLISFLFCLTSKYTALPKWFVLLKSHIHLRVFLKLGQMSCMIPSVLYQITSYVNN